MEWSVVLEWYPLDSLEWQWFLMAANHWPNNGLVSFRGTFSYSAVSFGQIHPCLMRMWVINVFASHVMLRFVWTGGSKSYFHWHRQHTLREHESSRHMPGWISNKNIFVVVPNTFHINQKILHLYPWQKLSLDHQLLMEVFMFYYIIFMLYSCLFCCFLSVFCYWG